LRVFITTLRKKLERNPTRPTHIVTEPGVGYRLVVDSQRADVDMHSSD
jgi:two-component system KDP operon response regulator KdpE